jgi:hypothetical protein
MHLFCREKHLKTYQSLANGATNVLLRIQSRLPELHVLFRHLGCLENALLWSIRRVRESHLPMHSSDPSFLLAGSFSGSDISGLSLKRGGDIKERRGGEIKLSCFD